MEEKQPLLSKPIKTEKIPYKYIFIAFALIIYLFYIYKLTEFYNNKQELSIVSTTTSNIEFEHTHKNQSLIYLIRHNEKYTDQAFGLSLQGLNHSLCLVNYFKFFPLGKPQIAYAEKSKEERAEQTLLPTTLFLNIPFQAKWDKTQMKNLIHAIKRKKYSRIVVAYEHHHLPYLAQALGCSKCLAWNTNPLSNKTLNTLFNITWVFSLTHFTHLYVYTHNYQNETCQTENFLYPFQKF